MPAVKAVRVTFAASELAGIQYLATVTETREVDLQAQNEEKRRDVRPRIVRSEVITKQTGRRSHL